LQRKYYENRLLKRALDPFIGLLFLLSFLISSKPAEAALVNTSQSPGSLSQGLVGHWTFDGHKLITNVTDSSGLGNNGSLLGFGATSSAIVAAKFGQALKFDGVDDRVALPATSAVGVNADDNFSISAWVKFSNTARGTIYAIGSTSSGARWFIFDANAVVGKIGFRSQDSLGITSYVYGPTSTNNNGKWHHVVFTQAGTSPNITRTIYIDSVAGTPQTSLSWAGIASQVNSYRIGTLQTGNTNEILPFAGSIDDVRTYSRALSDSEIKQLYNLGLAKINTSQNPAGTLSSGLIGWWTFDGKNLINNVVDSSGAGNTGYFRMGTTGNTATSSAIVAGKIGQGLKFDGISDQIITGSDFINTLPVTITAWIRPTSLRAGAPRIVDNTKTRFYLSSASRISFSSDGATGVISGNNVPINGKWQFVAVTRTAAGVANFYANGVPSGTANLNSGTPTAGSIVAIGGISGGATSNPFEGSMDDVRIYNRVLTAAEIKQLYNQSSAKVNTSQNPAGTLSSGLVGWWTFDGKNLIQNAADSSGLGNNGTLQGFGATSSAVVAGKLGQGLKFDGVNDYVKIGTYDIGGGTITTCAWVYITAATGNGAVIGDVAYFMAVTSTDGRINVTSNNNNYANSASSAITNNKWNHVCAVRLDSGTASLYANGVLSGTPNQTNTIVTSAFTTAIGTRGNAPAFYFKGNIDDVRLYSRALSASEIKQLYNMGR